jgi:hypothetical protein
MCDSDLENSESVTMSKKRMLKDAQKSIAHLLQEIQHHRFPKYPTQQKIIQPKTQIKFAANREIPRTCGAGKKNKVTVNKPGTKNRRLPLLSLEGEPQTKG